MHLDYNCQLQNVQQIASLHKETFHSETLNTLTILWKDLFSLRWHRNSLYYLGLLTYFQGSMLFPVPWKFFTFPFVLLIPSHPSDLCSSITFSGKLCWDHLSMSNTHSIGTNIDTNLLVPSVIRTMVNVMLLLSQGHQHCESRDQAWFWLSSPSTVAVKEWTLRGP